MKKIRRIGGARIGGANYTWPLASLTADVDQLKIATIFNSFRFSKKDIKSIDVIYYVPMIAQGIKINHTVSNYKLTIIFWTLSNPYMLKSKLNEMGW